MGTLLKELIHEREKILAIHEIVKGEQMELIYIVLFTFLQLAIRNFQWIIDLSFQCIGWELHQPFLRKERSGRYILKIKCQVTSLQDCSLGMFSKCHCLCNCFLLVRSCLRHSYYMSQRVTLQFSQNALFSKNLKKSES